MNFAKRAVIEYIAPASLLADFYKISHRVQYPVGTEVVYSVWTARGSRKEGIDHIVMFGLQYFIKKYLIYYFNKYFFNRPLEDVVAEYKRTIKFCLNDRNPDADHIIALHKLGYLPLCIKAVKEGTLVPIKVPSMTIESTIPEFYWLTNYFETLISCEIWMPTTSATIAFQYRKIMNKYAIETVGDAGAVDFQGHDFSMRGMAGLEAAKASGAGHLLSFFGSDTIPAIFFLEEFYNTSMEVELIGTSIPATEHSVMCAHGQGNEFDTYKWLITERYPSGFLSIVSDTWDLWKVLNEIIRELKAEILSRDGRIVVRPDSGDPVLIICGDPNGKTEWERKGVIQILWEIFGGTITKKGYKLLDSHIGAIYGDAISLERCEEICRRLQEKGFASTNIVFGIGSYTYQYNTRDTFGFALKSTFVRVNGEDRMIQKDPVTDTSRIKKSQTGLVKVYSDENGQLTYADGYDSESYWNDDIQDQLEVVFDNGSLVRDQSLAEIRAILKSNL